MGDPTMPSLVRVGAHVPGLHTKREVSNIHSLGAVATQTHPLSTKIPVFAGYG